MNVLQTIRQLEDHSVLAVDGEVGGVEDFFFDDTTWTIRYLAVNAGAWLAGRYLLVSPIAIGDIDEERKTINVELTRNQIENSPPVSAEEPITRKYEAEYSQYFNWTPYWELEPQSGYRAATPAAPPSSLPEYSVPGLEDTFLNSTAEVTGYAVIALDGELGNVEGFIVDTRYWVIRYLEVDTRNRWPGRHVLVNSAWVEELNSTQRAISVDLTYAAIKSAPDFNPSDAISREYETRLFEHYRRPVYWRRDDST